MKVAVSVPDPLFEAAERISQKLHMPRSQLYAKALEAFVKSHRAPGIRESLEAVYGTEASELDPLLEDLQAEALREDW
jgi:metal-responsive CopG/Arc/MetJ family transcriptional regulator